MGDPRKTRKKFETPGHPWIATRIEEEKSLKRTFGTKSKRELYKMETRLKRFKDQAKRLAARSDAQSKVEHEQMMKRIASLGLLSVEASLDDILSLTVHDLMNRRLQTVLVKRLLARTPKQARQLITHGHVLVGDKIITSPSFLVGLSDESNITFRSSSPLNNDGHPERFSEAELEAQQRRAAEKAAAKSGVVEEEAPPTFKEEDLEDPEAATAKKPEAKAEEKPAVEAPKKTAVKKAAVKKAAAKTAAKKEEAKAEEKPAEEAKEEAKE